MYSQPCLKEIILKNRKNQNHKGIGKKAEINAKFLYLIIKYVILHPSNFKLLEEYKKYDDYNDVKNSNIIKNLKISNTPYFFN